MEPSSLTTGGIPNTKQVYVPRETLDDPFDVTLVVEDGKEFKAHRRVLSEASPFFKAMFNCDMKESNQGVVRLEMLTELGLRDILEFIYTGRVQISAKDNVQELIAIADYLMLPHLKTLAGQALVERLNASNAISACCFAERFRCIEIISSAKTYILANFSVLAKTKDFLNLSSDIIKMFISSTEIDVSAEEDVFRAILTWIGYKESERKQYFAELFREVRLVYVSRDFLHSDIMTNDLVNENEGCMDLVKEAMQLIDSEDYRHISVQPRKSLETPAIVVRLEGFTQDDQILCYYPREDRWSRFRGIAPSNGNGKVISSNGKSYFISQRDSAQTHCSVSCYDTFSNCWTSISFAQQRRVKNVFVRNESEIYALLSEDGCCPGCVSLRSRGMNSPCGKRHLSFITKYKPETNSWEDVISFDLGCREDICVVTKGNFIYFLGGYERNWHRTLNNADRYDVSTNTWDKIADLQEPRRDACSASAYGKIFIAGGKFGNHLALSTCEVYNETTNEWQYTERSTDILSFFDTNLMSVGGKLYHMKSGGFIYQGLPEDRVIECYDADSNRWKKKTEIPLRLLSMGSESRYFKAMWCSVRVFIGHGHLEQGSFLDGGKVFKRKCSIM